MCKNPYSLHTYTHNTNKQLQLINKFSEISGYTIKIQKLVAFLHNNNKLSKNLENNPICNNIKKNKILRIKHNQGEVH